jgi:hypothetical protein
MATKTKSKATTKPKAAAGSKVSGAPDVCFVIMPFGGWLDKYYEDIYVPAIESVGLEPHRADDLFRPSTIVNDIWAYTKRAKLLLADLSGKNPNVFYELGLAHALAKPAILIAESMEDIPFDLRALRIITYNKNAPDWGKLLMTKLQSSMKEVIESPAEAVLPAFLSVKNEVGKTTVTGKEREFIEIKQELDLLRRELRSRSSPDAGSLNEASRPALEPDEAINLMRRYLAQGLPDEFIMRRLREANVPPDWVGRRLRSERARHQDLTTTAETPAAE